MDTIRFENEALPIYIKAEDMSKREIHSEIAHWHDNIELIVVNNGTVHCQTAGTGFELHKGDVCFINRRQLHQIHAEDGSACCHKVLIIGTSLLTQNALIHEKYIRPMLEDAQFSHVRFSGNSSPAGEISGLITQIEKLKEELPCGYELELIAAVHRLCRQLYLAYANKAPSGPLDNNARIQQKMAEFIYAEYSRQLSLDDIAASGNVSRSQCIKLFNQYTSMSPVVFLNQHRLEVSLTLLRSSAGSIADIAQACGFPDQSYFSRLFQRQYGCTPLAYRKSGKI